MSKQTSPTGDGPARRHPPKDRTMALALVVVAALFCGILIGAMTAAHLARSGEPPPESPALEGMREALAREPDNEALQQAVREQDARVRRAYLARRRLIAAGAVLLLAGAVGLALALHWYASTDSEVPMPLSREEQSDRKAWEGRRRLRLAAVATLAAAVLVGLVSLAVVGGPDFPREDAPPTPPSEAPAVITPQPAAEPPEVAEVPAHLTWPHFRGHGGRATVQDGDWPGSWDAETGENIAWKSPIDLPGRSSPVVWGDRIFLTGADENSQAVFCYDRASGELLWRTSVQTPDAPDEVEVFMYTGYAAPTAATDGQRVYAFFATADLAALDFDGNVLWEKNLGEPENVYGIASSPLTYEGNVIVQFDRGVMAEDAPSALIALDGATGEEVWRTQRPVPNSWSSPILAETPAGTELITSAAPWVIAYDPADGEELWRADVLGGDVGPSPFARGDRVFVTTDHARIAAIRTGGFGDVTDSNVLWSARDGLSDAPSPVADDRLCLQVASSAWLTCFDAETGELLWEDYLDEEIWSSPVLVGDLVYLTDAAGVTHIFPLADSFEVTSTGRLGEAVYATPAFVDSRIYIRGEDHLWCIGK